MTEALQSWCSDVLSELGHPLALFGFAAQFIFMARFVVQWYVSEKRQRSTVPVMFWYISLLGGLMLFIYAALQRDPVIMCGQALGCLIYIRNLVLIHRRHSRVNGKRAARRGEVLLEDAAAEEADAS